MSYAGGQLGAGRFLTFAVVVVGMTVAVLVIRRLWQAIRGLDFGARSRVYACRLSIRCRRWGQRRLEEIQLKTGIFRIEGMHCEGCAQTIEAVVGQVPGVKQVAVSFEAREAQVEFDTDVANDTRIASAIERAGFRPQRLGR